MTRRYTQEMDSTGQWPVRDEESPYDANHPRNIALSMSWAGLTCCGAMVRYKTERRAGTEYEHYRCAKCGRLAVRRAL